METNLHSNAIPPEVVEALKQKTREISDLLAPYATPLTAQERRELPIMGDKTVSFVEKAFEFAQANADLCPNFLDIPTFRIDMDDATGLRVVRNNVRQAFEVVDDIVLLAGSEAYQSALTFYNYIKLLVAQDVPRAKTIYEELKQRFPGRSKAKKNDNADNT
ncbi:MAG: hypothetical protein LBQ28_02050 [Prevotellaceae bacterium]|jgi:hypothetical protein|nr:hypothetical protein [Prevotellaceae bacterium]